MPTRIPYPAHKTILATAISLALAPPAVWARNSSAPDPISIDPLNTAAPSAYPTAGLMPHSSVMDADGNTTVVWAGSDGAIMMRRFDKAGTKGTESTVSSPTDAADETTFLKYPVIAQDQTGAFVVAWQKGDTGGISAQRYDNTGAAVGTAFSISADGLNPGIAMHPANGGVVAAWVSSTGGIAAILLDSGNTPGAEIAVSTAGSAPAVAMDPSGNFVVAYQDAATGNHLTSGTFKDESNATQKNYWDETALVARRFSSSGTTGTAAGDPITVATDKFSDSTTGKAGGNTTQTQKSTDNNAPIVAMDGTGDFIVVWGEDKGTVTTKYKLGKHHAASGCYTSYGARICEVEAYDEPGTTTETEKHAYAVYVRRYESDGTAKDRNKATLIVKDGQAPSIAMDASGNFAVSWAKTKVTHHDASGCQGSGEYRYCDTEAYDETSSDVYGKKYKVKASGKIGPNGSTVSVTDTSTKLFEHFSSVALDSSGDASVVWVGEASLTDAGGYGGYGAAGEATLRAKVYPAPAAP